MEHSLGVASDSSTEMQLLYFTFPDDWAKSTDIWNQMIRGVLSVMVKIIEIETVTCVQILNETGRDGKYDIKQILHLERIF